MSFFIDYKILSYSITNTIEVVENKKDSSEPYSFIDFVKNLDIDNTSNQVIVEFYNQYLIEWTKIKNVSGADFEEIRREKYVSLLKNIQINFLSQDEQRILGNINYDDPLELDIAIPFFVEKIKDIIDYYLKKRRDVKQSKSKWSIKGSPQFLKNVIADFIVDNYVKTPNTFQRYKENYQELSSFQNNYNLNYDGLYDFNDYRKEEFSFDPKLFLSSSGDYDLSSLENTDFLDYFEDSQKTISEYKKKLFQKYISTDKTYYGENGSVDVNSTTPFYDPYNYDKPYISRIANTTNLLRDVDVGFYFTSKYIYTSNYFSPYGISIANTEELIDLTPKIDVYRSEDYKDYYFWSKYPSIFQGLFNKPVSNKRLKRFYGYQSRDLNIDDSVGGVEKYTDDIQIWRGNKNSEWANSDVFDKFSSNILNRKLKTDFFFNLEDGESVYKYSCDIFGNQYYLIKKINLSKSKTLNVYPLLNSIISDTLDVPNISLLGQRETLTTALEGIVIQENVVLGFYISTLTGTTFNIENLSDYNLIETNYYNLVSDIYDTIVKNEEDEINQKSLYENQYTTGRLIIRDSNNKTVQNVSDILVENTFGDIQNDLIDIDIIDDFILFTTGSRTDPWRSKIDQGSSRMITAKIKYDYKTSILSFTDISKNTLPFYNLNFQKTSSYWYETKSKRIYFANIDFLVDDYSIYYFNTETNDLRQYIIDNSEIIDTEKHNLMSFRNISRPQIIKDLNRIYVINLAVDLSYNYYYNIIAYEIVNDVNLKAIYNKIYHPNKLWLTSDIKSDSLAQNSELSSVIDDNAVNFGGSNIWMWDVENNLPESYSLTYLQNVNRSHYDNDTNSVITRLQPDFSLSSYKLSDMLQGITPEENSSTTEDNFDYDGGYIYNHINILLDYREIENFVTRISRTEPIYKIQYYLGEKIKTQYILSQDDLMLSSTVLSSSGFDGLSALATESDNLGLSAVAETDDTSPSALALDGGATKIGNPGFYNIEFIISPINMKYIYHNTSEGSSFTIIFYSSTGKKFRFDFNFELIDLSLSKRFNKIELLDARVKKNQDGSKDCVLYLNTRNPDYVINTSILNI